MEASEPEDDNKQEAHGVSININSPNNQIAGRDFIVHINLNHVVERANEADIKETRAFNQEESAELFRLVADAISSLLPGKASDVSFGSENRLDRSTRLQQ